VARQDGLPLVGAVQHIRFARAQGAFSARDRERAGLLATRLGLTVELADQGLTVELAARQGRQAGRPAVPRALVVASSAVPVRHPDGHPGCRARRTARAEVPTAPVISAAWSG